MRYEHHDGLDIVLNMGALDDHPEVYPNIFGCKWEGWGSDGTYKIPYKNLNVKAQMKGSDLYINNYKIDPSYYSILTTTDKDCPFYTVLLHFREDGTFGYALTCYYNPDIVGNFTTEDYEKLQWVNLTLGWFYNLLNTTDFKVLKRMEGYYTDEEWKGIVADRKYARSWVNRIEAFQQKYQRVD